MKVLAISDVTLGYGTPQLPLLTLSLVAHYKAEGHVIEPAQPELTARHALFPILHFDRVTTVWHPHSEQGRQEYLWRASRSINQLRPEVLVICCTYCLPVIFRLDYRPRKVIYYSVESIPFYGPFDMEMNGRAGPLVDIVIFPEENRAVAEVSRFGFHGATPDREPAKLVLYNTTNFRKTEPPLPRPSRNGRFLYAGTISDQTFASYYTRPETQRYPIDMFGPVKLGLDGARQEFLDALGGGIRYRGYIDAHELARVRRSYLYSLVAWNPVNENQLYAAPNKFFDSIADGIPPIAAPHPQCKVILERYGCGILMDDWSYEAFAGALRKAMRIHSTPAWVEMVEGCRRAVARELHWEAQFARLRPYLD